MLVALFIIAAAYIVMQMLVESAEMGKDSAEESLDRVRGQVTDLVGQITAIVEESATPVTKRKEINRRLNRIIVPTYWL